ncbi:hypothetical protein SO802_000990 [Lithocarpus litseifolius]|uniref:Reverse transcriptase n=1 Tax=Lithocarpus litseifolius TaxID=425828 RepID=A0AAW2DYB1_9ROSI
MKILVWNYKGVGNSNFRRNFSDLNRLHRPSIAVIMETRISGARGEDISFNLGFDNVCCSDANGFNGGIWILWNSNETTLDILSVTDQAIHAFVQVCAFNLDSVWLFFAIYANLNLSTRLHLSEDLASFASSHSVPWLLAALYSNHSPFLTNLEKNLNLEFQHILKLEEEIWAVKSRTEWTLLGDRNTKFFHLFIICRRHHNKIWCLKDSAGNWTHSPTDIHDQILPHFTSLYTLEALCAHWNHTSPPHFPSIPKSLLDLHDISNTKIKEATFSFKPLKAPGPDGFHLVFFQKYWNIVGRSVTSLKQIFRTHKIPKDLNATLLCLIPKNL